jgi:hypothetical protein
VESIEAECPKLVSIEPKVDILKSVPAHLVKNTAAQCAAEKETPFASI